MCYYGGRGQGGSPPPKKIHLNVQDMPFPSLSPQRNLAYHALGISTCLPSPKKNPPRSPVVLYVFLFWSGGGGHPPFPAYQSGHEGCQGLDDGRPPDCRNSPGRRCFRSTCCCGRSRIRCRGSSGSRRCTCCTCLDENTRQVYGDDKSLRAKFQ